MGSSLVDAQNEAREWLGMVGSPVSVSIVYVALYVVAQPAI